MRLPTLSDLQCCRTFGRTNADLGTAVMREMIGSTSRAKPNVRNSFATRRATQSLPGASGTLPGDMICPAGAEGRAPLAYGREGRSKGAMVCRADIG